MKPAVFFCFLASLTIGSRAFAEPHPTCTGPLVGTWTLLSMETDDLETSEKNNLLGVHPSGYLTYGSDCRMYAILVKESRELPADTAASDPESIKLYRGLISFAGTYSIDGSKITHHIEASWNQAWSGTTQVQHFRIDETTLFIHTDIGKSPLTGRRSTTAFIWTRVD